MILDIEFETPCGSIIKVDLRVKNDGAKVPIQDAEIVSEVNIILDNKNLYPIYDNNFLYHRTHYTFLVHHIYELYNEVLVLINVVL